MPGRGGTGQSQFFSQSLADGESAIAKSRKRAAGAAELNDERLVTVARNTRPTAPQGRQPSRRLQAEGNGRRRLQQRTPQHDRCRMLLRNPIQLPLYPLMV